MSNRRRTARRAAALACAGVLVAGGCSTDDSGGPSTTATAGDSAPAVACEALGEPQAGPGDDGLPALRLPCLGDGPDVTLNALTGRPTLINLWASWCAPCREEMPLLQQAFEDYGREVRFLGVVTRDEPAVAADFAAAIGVGYPHAVDADGALLNSLSVPGLPVTLAVDSAGRIVRTQIGQMTSAELSSLLTELRTISPDTGPGG